MTRVLFTTIRVVYGLEGADGDLRSNRVLGRESGTIRLRREKMETCGQFACAVGRLPIRFSVGTGGTIIF